MAPSHDAKQTLSLSRVPIILHGPIFESNPQAIDLEPGTHLCLSGEAAEAEANGGVGHVLLHAQRAQHVAGLQAGAGARAAAADRDVLHRELRRCESHAQLPFLRSGAPVRPCQTRVPARVWRPELSKAVVSSSGD